MKQRLLVPSLVLVGLVFLVAGLSWSHLVSSSAYWGPEQAEEFNAAQFDLHAKSHHHENESHTDEQEFIASKERFDKISNQLTRARSSRAFTATALESFGVLALLVASVIYFKGHANA